MQTIYIASDHAAFESKQQIIKELENDYNIIDLGTDSNESTDYPKYGKLIAEKVVTENGRGIALCGSGIGISIQVNRYKGVRGALCRDMEDARMSRLHNDSNILCLGARSTDLAHQLEIIKIWLSTEFEGGRHQRRIDLLDN